MFVFISLLLLGIISHEWRANSMMNEATGGTMNGMIQLGDTANDMYIEEFWRQQ